mmetsp:Transcript_11433/g.32188  ORF Transcript_11433/g.32188 Transcript_11433/m.32188 type:complete len:224 (+) Transcript_11433:591-1262(+)
MKSAASSRTARSWLPVQRFTRRSNSSSWRRSASEGRRRQRSAEAATRASMSPTRSTRWERQRWAKLPRCSFMASDFFQGLAYHWCMMFTAFRRTSTTGSWIMRKTRAVHLFCMNISGSCFIRRSVSHSVYRRMTSLTSRLLAGTIVSRSWVRTLCTSSALAFAAAASRFICATCRALRPVPEASNWRCDVSYKRRREWWWCPKAPAIANAAMVVACRSERTAT